MRKFASLAVLLALSIGAYAEDIQLRFVRPSRVLGMLMVSQIQSGFAMGKEVRVGRLEGADEGIVPKGVILTALDSKGILRVEGPDSGLKDVKTFISLLDVEPRKVALSLELNCPVLNVSSTTTTTLLNSRVWTMRDSTTDVDLTVSPRVNADDTISIYIDIQRGDQKQRMVARVKPGQKLFLNLGKTLRFAMPETDSKDLLWTAAPDLTKGKESSDAQGDIDDPEMIISLQMKVEEPAAKSNVRN